MTTIHLERAHHTTLRKAKAASQKIADALHAEFELESEWAGDTLTFTRPGISGQLVVSATTVAIRIEVGLLLSFISSRIENEVRLNLEKAFPG